MGYGDSGLYTTAPPAVVPAHFDVLAPSSGHFDIRVRSFAHSDASDVSLAHSDTPAQPASHSDAPVSSSSRSGAPVPSSAPLPRRPTNDLPHAARATGRNSFHKPALEFPTNLPPATHHAPTTRRIPTTHHNRQVNHSHRARPIVTIPDHQDTQTTPARQTLDITVPPNPLPEPPTSPPEPPTSPRGPETPSPAPPTMSRPAPNLPPPNHPSWGVNGIMHGVYLQGAHTYLFDPRYVGQRRDALQHGHNGLTPGDWWPLQVVAVYNGAHGQRVRGISGDPQTGAYSVVVSGLAAQYRYHDRDNGDVVWYSADRPNAGVGLGRRGRANPNANNASSNNNTSSTSNGGAGNNTGSNSNNSAGGNNQQAAPAPAPAPRPQHSADTRALLASERTGLPVRVLRSAGHRNRHWAPAVGIRYDGLYRVVRHIVSHNSHGGQFLKFELRRLNPAANLGMTLNQIRTTVPTQAQRAAEASIRDRY
ncbi:PUA-like domain-containing protein [Dichotomopilus funicola]|uniref:PUA-like domain-containing protein n=1 Tax=Dichotomopilus funicola TaxID=1934379 RepID=A0AAN6V6U1_9PEZI|nr:PUA-like domain-containing protein [Dichotomopilus funicola]